MAWSTEYLPPPKSISTTYIPRKSSGSDSVAKSSKRSRCHKHIECQYDSGSAREQSQHQSRRTYHLCEYRKHQRRHHAYSYRVFEEVLGVLFETLDLAYAVWDHHRPRKDTKYQHRNRNTPRREGLTLEYDVHKTPYNRNHSHNVLCSTNVHTPPTAENRLPENRDFHLPQRGPFNIFDFVLDRMRLG